MLTAVFTDFQHYATQSSKNRNNASFRLIILFWCLESLRPACSCVVGYIRAYFDVFSLFLASPSASFRSLGLSTHFRPYSQVTLEVHPGTGNLHCLSLALFLKAVQTVVMKRKSIIPVILSTNRLEQAGEHPLRRFPLLDGPANHRRTK